MNIIRQTTSVCPHCLKTLSAVVYEKDSEVYMHKTCPVHGRFDVYLWPDSRHYKEMLSFDFPSNTRPPQTRTNRGCPNDCGLCPNHKRKITLPEIEVTWRCNLSCPVCFMNDGSVPKDPDMSEIRDIYNTINSVDGHGLSIQITGGEPTVRSDLPDIIALGKELGFSAIELNTNGIKIGGDLLYLKELKKAGLTNVYLQFDGLNPLTTMKLRGKDLLNDKLTAIENCREEKVPVVLSVTIVQGINDRELGTIIQFAMNNLDVIKGLALQPAFVSGRFDVEKPRHLSVGDVARLIAQQTKERIRASDFWPVGSSHPLCYGSTYLIGEGEHYRPFTHNLKKSDYLDMLSWDSPQGAMFTDIVAALSPSGQLPAGLPILIMEYMDAWTMDLERAQGCNLAVTGTQGSSIPFCIYHLSDTKGNRLYDHGGKRIYG